MGALLRAAAQRLADAGVASPRADAEELLAEALGSTRAAVVLAGLRGDAGPDEGRRRAFRELVARRARRTPLQHLTGRAGFRGLELRVGPGVFVPRPETEGLAGAAVLAAEQAAEREGRPAVVVDLCTGSGAVALAVAAEVPRARVLGVELSEDALAWARLNATSLGALPPLAGRAGGAVEVVAGDAATALPELDGAVDVVVSNPPYIPPGAVPVDPEVRDHDPHVALFGGGDDGLAVPRAVLARAAALLRPGGVVLVEHAEVQQPALLAALAGPAWTGAEGAADLTGRPRRVRAVRVGAPGAGGPPGRGAESCHDARS
ncbi:peptide chain release factor N(5)-glutamine methyltransferase [uncultured Pseudokineococcus sp.]|uniref:peptide chain release factor N(5)-glutamine methyltransferase n=1 Tax=uncultured Pseudokineococcus sp. TaxID=1642928 RepID=UPI00260F6693|nr:peptide chain release factor N(5)-glutamine methyltransferase [uncultured Pseudokineococcus sp.]